MTQNRSFAMTLIAAAVLAACSTAPMNNAMLDQARSDYRSAKDDPQTRDLAGGELKFAGDAVTTADAALQRGEQTVEVDHLVYVARQRVAIANETAKQKAAELAVSNAGAARDKARLDARTNEADAAALKTAQAQRDTASAKRDASDAQAHATALEAQLADLNAKQTERGMVISIGDVLFDTDRAELRSGAARNVDKLVAFMKQYPQRRAMIEGFTDNTGSDSHNLSLSGRRADAVRTAMVDMGVGGERLATHGYGEAFPVAGNDSAGGRQANRRVEIVLSDEVGNITPR